jgi:hypothetical protein
MPVVDLVVLKDFKGVIIKWVDITKVNLNRFQAKDSNNNTFSQLTPLSSEVPTEQQRAQLGFPPPQEA